MLWISRFISMFTLDRYKIMKKLWKYNANVIILNYIKTCKIDKTNL